MRNIFFAVLVVAAMTPASQADPNPSQPQRVPSLMCEKITGKPQCNANEAAVCTCSKEGTPPSCQWNGCSPLASPGKCLPNQPTPTAASAGCAPGLVAAQGNAIGCDAGQNHWFCVPDGSGTSPTASDFCGKTWEDESKAIGKVTSDIGPNDAQGKEKDFLAARQAQDATCQAVKTWRQDFYARCWGKAPFDKLGKSPIPIPYDRVVPSNTQSGVLRAIYYSRHVACSCKFLDDGARSADAATGWAVSPESYGGRLPNQPSAEDCTQYAAYVAPATASDASSGNGNATGAGP